MKGNTVKYALGIILAFAASVAFATQTNGGNTCNGNGSCGTVNNTTNNTTNQGGQGGSGGTAVVNNSGNSFNVNTNKSEAEARAAAAAAAVSFAAQSQGINAPVTASPTTTVTVETNTPKQPVSGPGIASSPSATCRIAVGLSVGGTFGSVGGFGSVEDANCVRNEKIRMLKEVLGRGDAAKALACKDADMAEAMGDCPKEKKAEAAGQPTAAVSTNDTTAAINSTFRGY